MTVNQLVVGSIPTVGANLLYEKLEKMIKISFWVFLFEMNDSHYLHFLMRTTLS